MKESFDSKDFELIKVDTSDGHEDYWFKVHGAAKEFLTQDTMEQSMIEVTECVYSKDEDVVGIERLFPFNCDVVISSNNELKRVLRSLVNA